MKSTVNDLDRNLYSLAFKNPTDSRSFTTKSILIVSYLVFKMERKCSFLIGRC